MTTILWFGRDLRLADNHALAAAVSRGQAIIPLFILDDEDSGNWAAGGASHWWLHGSLEALSDALRRRGTQLILRRGKAEAAIERTVQQTGATAVYWDRRYEPWATARNERLKNGLTERGISAKSFNSALIREPWTLKTRSGDPYRVFTPFCVLSCRLRLAPTLLLSSSFSRRPLSRGFGSTKSDQKNYFVRVPSLGGSVFHHFDE